MLTSQQNRAKELRGFTLLELTIVIVVVAIVLAIAVVKYSDFTPVSKQEAVNAVASSLTSASNLNYSASKSGLTSAVTVANCTDISAALTGGNNLPPGYIIFSQSVAVDQSIQCTVVHSDGVTAATFMVKGTP